MLTLIPIKKGIKDFHRIQQLYRRAFPKNERDPISHLLKESNSRSNFVALYDGPLFCGFVYLLSYGTLTHILYLAIEESLRGKGYGTRALEAIRDWKQGDRILVDVEAEDPNCENCEQRIRRIQFYRSNGFVPAGIEYTWETVHYEILVSGGTVTSSEFDHFWQHFREDEDMGNFLYDTFMNR